MDRLVVVVLGRSCPDAVPQLCVPVGLALHLWTPLAVCHLVTLIWLDLYRWLVWLVWLVGSWNPACPQPFASAYALLVVLVLEVMAGAMMAIGAVPAVLVAMPLLLVALLRVALLRLLPVLRVAELPALPVLRVALPPVVRPLVVEVVEVLVAPVAPVVPVAPVAPVVPGAPAGAPEVLLRLLLAVLLRRRRAGAVEGGAG